MSSVLRSFLKIFILKVSSGNIFNQDPDYEVKMQLWKSWKLFKFDGITHVRSARSLFLITFQKLFADRNLYILRLKERSYVCL